VLPDPLPDPLLELESEPLSLASRRCWVGLSGSLLAVVDELLLPLPVCEVEGLAGEPEELCDPDELVCEPLPLLPLPEPELELASPESLRWSVGRSGSLLLVEDEGLSPPLESFWCSVGRSEPASFTTCGGCFDMGGFALAMGISGLTDPTAIHELLPDASPDTPPPRFSAPFT
jgi:hypothetical protein